MTDDEYDYCLGGRKIPYWLGEALEVPGLIVFLLGLVTGLVLAGGAILFGMYLAWT